MEKKYIIENRTIKINQGITRIGKDEMNLIELPFTLLTKRNPKNLKTIERNWISKGEDGKERKFYKTITGSDKWGLPTFIGEEVFLACMELSYRYGFKSREVHTSQYELIKLMGWPINGKSYKRLITAFNQLAGIMITTNFFWDNQEKKYIKLGFGIIDDYVFFEDEKKTKSRYNPSALPLGHFHWNEIFFKNSIQKSYIKTLDTEIYFSLESYIAKRLYRYADKKLYKQDSFRIDLFKLAFDKLEMTGNYKYPSKIIEKLTKSSRTTKEKQKKSPIEELKEKGINITIEKSQTDSGYKVCFNRTNKIINILQKPIESENIKLVNYFHNRLSHQQQEPTKTELEQAQGLLNKYGQQKSQYIIDFAIQEAQKTNFKMQYLGAVLGKYEIAAINQQEQKEQQKIKAKKRVEQEKSQNQYQEYKKQITSQYITQLNTTDYQEKFDTAKNKLQEEQANIFKFTKPGHYIYRKLIEDEMIEELIKQEKLKIKDFESWRKNQ